MTDSEIIALVIAFVFGWVVIGPILAIAVHKLLDKHGI